MQYLDKYYEEVIDDLREIHEQESEKIQLAGVWIGQAIMDGHLLHVWGTGGHSSMAGEEVFYRAGGLAAVNAILDPGVSLNCGGRRSTKVERTEGYARGILDLHNLEAGDVMLIVNANGMNALTVDTALVCKELDVKTIGITSRACSDSIPPDQPGRHSTRKSLYEVADMYIDCKAIPGEALVQIEGCSQPVGPSSTSTIAFIEHSIVIATVAYMVSKGFEPVVWKSANIPGGDEANKENLKKYAPRCYYL
jgi:uncharacterized phosphosugar-binding protein